MKKQFSYYSGQGDEAINSRVKTSVNGMGMYSGSAWQYMCSKGVHCMGMLYAGVHSLAWTCTKQDISSAVKNVEFEAYLNKKSRSFCYHMSLGHFMQV